MVHGPCLHTDISWCRILYNNYQLEELVNGTFDGLGNLQRLLVAVNSCKLFGSCLHVLLFACPAEWPIILASRS